MSSDLDDFRALFEELKDPMFRFLLRLTRNPTDAEDLLQDTFLAVWRKREQFEGRGSTLAYLRRTAFHLYLNAREVAERRASLAPRATDRELAVETDHELDKKDSVRFLVDRVEEALDALPPPAREAFVLFRYEGMSSSEIAAVVGAPIKTVETRIARATHLLCERLSPYRHHVAAL